MTKNKSNIFAIVAVLIYIGAIAYPFFYAKLWEDKMVSTFMPAAERDFVEQYFVAIKTKNFEQINQQSGDKLRDPKNRNVFEQLSHIIPATPPTRIVALAYRVNETVLNASDGSKKTINWRQVSLQYGYPDKTLVVNTTLIVDKERFFVEGFTINVIVKPIEELTSFSLYGKSPLTYLMLVIAITLIIFNLYTLVLCIKTPIARGKWVWIIFILVGVGKVTFNSFSDEISFSLLSVIVPPVYFWVSNFLPMSITLSLPLGSIIFLAGRKQLLAHNEKIRFDQQNKQ